MADKRIYIENWLLIPVHLHFAIEDDALCITVDKFGRENEECVLPGHTVIFDDIDTIRACTRNKQMRYGFKNETGEPFTVQPEKYRNIDGPVFQLIHASDR